MALRQCFVFLDGANPVVNFDDFPRYSVTSCISACLVSSPPASPASESKRLRRFPASRGLSRRGKNETRGERPLPTPTDTSISSPEPSLGDVFLSNFYMALRVFTFQNASFIFVGLRLVVLIAETFERQGIFRGGSRGRVEGVRTPPPLR